MVTRGDSIVHGGVAGKLPHLVFLPGRSLVHLPPGLPGRGVQVVRAAAGRIGLHDPACRKRSGLRPPVKVLPPATPLLRFSQLRQATYIVLPCTSTS